MKPKSFKSNGGGSPYQPDLSSNHYAVTVERFRIMENLLYSVILDGRRDDRYILETGDVLALAIGDSPKIVMARVFAIQADSDQFQFTLAEHNKQSVIEKADLRSSKPLPSAAWETFLKELKKCGCGHHNKKRKTLLHLIKMAKAIAHAPGRILLTVRPAALLKDLQDVAEQIQTVIDEDAGGGGLDLDELESFFPNDVDEVVVVDANRDLQQPMLEATTLVANRVNLETSITSDKEGLVFTIPGKAFSKAARLHTGGGGSSQQYFLDWDRLSPDDIWFSSNREQTVVSVYSHENDSIVYHNYPVRKIKVLSNGKLEFELEASFNADVFMTRDVENTLFTLHNYRVALDYPEEYSGGFSPFAVPEEINQPGIENILSIDPEHYKFKALDLDDDYNIMSGVGDPDSNDDLLFHINHGKSTLTSQFVKSHEYWVGGVGVSDIVDDNQAVVTVDSVLVDADKGTAIVVFSHKGRDKFFKDRIRNNEQLIMKRLSTASAKKPAAIKLTLEKRAVSSTPDPAAGNVDDYVGDISQITDGITQLLEEEDLKSLSELAKWLEENPPSSGLELVVTGAEYIPVRRKIETLNSVTGVIGLNAWKSTNGEYTCIDLEPAEKLANIMSVVHIPGSFMSEVKKVSFLGELDEIKQKASEEFRRATLRQAADEITPEYEAYVSVYNVEGGHNVCSNEAILKIMRKKKDGKCIYRIVLKKSAMANRINHGKYGKCILYINQNIPLM